MLLLQYLIIFLEGDFLPRNCAFKEELNWTFLRESLVNMLLRSRKILYQSLIKDCLSLMHVLYQEAMFEDLSYHKSSSMESSQEINTAVALELPEIKKSTCAALKKFFLMVMELDSSRSNADMQGLSTRSEFLNFAFYGSGKQPEMTRSRDVSNENMMGVDKLP